MLISVLSVYLTLITTHLGVINFINEDQHVKTKAKCEFVFAVLKKVYCYCC